MTTIKRKSDRSSRTHTTNGIRSFTAIKSPICIVVTVLYFDRTIALGFKRKEMLLYI